MIELLAETERALDNLIKVDQQASSLPQGKEQAISFRQYVFPAMGALRKPVDELELIVDKNLWPVPTYGDLLFEV